MNFFSQSQTSEVDTPFFKHEPTSIFDHQPEPKDLAYNFFNQPDQPHKERSIFSQLQQQGDEDEENYPEEIAEEAMTAEDEDGAEQKQSRRKREELRRDEREEREERKRVEQGRKREDQRRKGEDQGRKREPMSFREKDTNSLQVLQNDKMVALHHISEPICLPQNSKMRRHSSQQKDVKPIYRWNKQKEDKGERAAELVKPKETLTSFRRNSLVGDNRGEKSIQKESMGGRLGVVAEGEQCETREQDSGSDKSNMGRLPFNLQVTSDFTPFQKKQFSFGCLSSKKEREEPINKIAFNHKKNSVIDSQSRNSEGVNQLRANALLENKTKSGQSSNPRTFFLGNPFRQKQDEKPQEKGEKHYQKGEKQQEKGGEKQQENSLDKTSKKSTLLESSSKERAISIQVTPNNSLSVNHMANLQKEQPKGLGLRQQLKKFGSRPTEKLQLKSIAPQPQKAVLPKTAAQPAPLLLKPRDLEGEEAWQTRREVKTERGDSWFVRTMMTLGDLWEQAEASRVRLSGAANREWDAPLLERQIRERLDRLLESSQTGNS